MKRQPGLKITANGITPDWFAEALPTLKKRRSEKKQESQRAAEQCDFITPEIVLEHFNTAERAGTWSRQSWCSVQKKLRSERWIGLLES